MNKTILENINRRLLSNQLLTKKAVGSGALISVAESCCGVNSQNYRDSFLSFWARTTSFSDVKLIKELRPKKGLARTWTVRGTVHTFPSKDYYIHVFGSPRDRFLGRFESYSKQLHVPPFEKRMGKLYLPLLDEIKGKAVTSSYIGNFISDILDSMGLKGRMKLRRGWTKETMYGPTWEGVAELSYLGLIVNAGRNGGSTLWMRTSDFLSYPTKNPDTVECATYLIRSYINKYGPVTITDIMQWTGHRKREVNIAMENLKGELTQDKYDGNNGIFYSLGVENDGYHETPEPIILPRFDSLMMGHFDRSRVMNPKWKGIVFTKTGIINPTLLVGGYVAGIWKKEKQSNHLKITVTQFKELKPPEKKLTEEKFAELADYLKTKVDVKWNQLT